MKETGDRNYVRMGIGLRNGSIDGSALLKHHDPRQYASQRCAK